MTNVFKTPEKFQLKKRLFEIGLETLRREGWKIERVPNEHKASVRRITKGREVRRITIRTTQDTWIAFPRSSDDKSWGTLADVDVVLAVSVDDAQRPTEARVHWLPGDEMRKRFDRAYKARQAADHQVPLGRGIWLPLYIKDDGTPRLVGGGAGLDHAPMAVVSLNGSPSGAGGSGPNNPKGPIDTSSERDGGDNDKPLTIAEAKRRLARTLGVAEESIKISIEA